METLRLVEYEPGPKNLNDCYLLELKESYDNYPEEARPVLDKMINGDRITSDEQQILTGARTQVWQEKYGYPYEFKKARAADMAKKYFTPETRGTFISDELVDVFRKGNQEEIDALKKRVEEESPLAIENIEVVFGLRDYLLQDKETRGRKEMDYEQCKAFFRNFTEYMFLVNHYMILNETDEEALGNFWRIGETISEMSDVRLQFERFRRGVITQVAAFKILEELGEEPLLSHPDDDAFNAVDLWAEGDMAVQIKGWEEDKPGVYETEEVSYPALRTADDEGQVLYSTNLMQETAQFSAKIKKLSEYSGKRIRGMMMVIPHAHINNITGEPDDAIVDYFRQYLFGEEAA